MKILLCSLLRLALLYKLRSKNHLHLYITQSDYMVYPDTPGIRHILEGLTKFPSIEGAFLKVKLNGKKDAVLKAMSQANALIGKEMCEPQVRLIYN